MRTSPATGSTSISAPSGISVNAPRCADDRGDAELARQHRGVTERTAVGGDDRAGEREHRVVRRRRARHYQHVTVAADDRSRAPANRRDMPDRERSGHRHRHRGGRLVGRSPPMPSCSMTICTMRTTSASGFGKQFQRRCRLRLAEAQRSVERRQFVTMTSSPSELCSHRARHRRSVSIEISSRRQLQVRRLRLRRRRRRPSADRARASPASAARVATRPWSGRCRRGGSSPHALLPAGCRTLLGGRTGTRARMTSMRCCRPSPTARSTPLRIVDTTTSGISPSVTPSMS